MSEESETISTKTWARIIEPVAKIGYMNGAYDGQSAVFQTSFDVGYGQGFTFGLELGFMEASIRLKEWRQEPLESILEKDNCQICLKEGISDQENINNLQNIQLEKNSEFLLKYKNTYFLFSMHREI